MAEQGAIAGDAPLTKASRGRYETIRGAADALVTQIKLLEEANEELLLEIGAAREVLKCYQDADPGSIFSVPIKRPGSLAADFEKEIRRYCRHFKEQAPDEELVRLGRFLRTRLGMNYDLVAECNCSESEVARAITEGGLVRFENGYGIVAVQRVRPSANAVAAESLLTESANRLAMLLTVPHETKLHSVPDLAIDEIKKLRFGKRDPQQGVKVLARLFKSMLDDLCPSSISAEEWAECDSPLRIAYIAEDLKKLRGQK